MAQQVLVYRLSGSAASLGMVNFLALIPLIPLSIWGGSFIDRHSKQKIIIWTQTALMLQAFLMALLSWLGIIQVWHVYVMSFILGAINAIDLPARQAFTVDMVEGKQDLTNAIGLNSAMFNMARAAGPAMAGLVVAATGEAIAFLVNAVTFLAVIFSLMMMQGLPEPKVWSKRGVSSSAHVMEGFQFIFKQRSIFYLVSLIAVSAFLSMPYSTLMPVFATKVLGQSAGPVINAVCGSGPIHIQCQSPEALPLGILLTVIGVGAVAGALITASLPETSRRGNWLTACNLFFPLMLVLFAISRSFISSTLLMVAVGFSFVVQNVLANTLLQLMTPDELRGRVMSVYTMTFQGAMRLGGLQAGYMADWFNAPLTVGLGAALSLVYGVWIAFKVPEVRDLK